MSVLAINTTLRLLFLRQLMNDTSVVGPNPLSAFIVPSNDGHQAERVPQMNARLKYISGFTGSMGTAMITPAAALIWVDGRYFIQATNEIDENWTLMKEGVYGTPTLDEYLGTNFPPGSYIGVDPAVYSITAWNKLQAKLDAAEQTLVAVPNIVDKVWDKDETNKRSFPDAPVIPIDIKYSGQTTADKLASLREIMQKRKVDLIVVIQLEDAAWLLNLRGTDVPAGAFFLAFMIITRDGFELFAEAKKFNKEITDSLTKDGGKIYPYDQIAQRLEQLVKQTTGKVLMDKNAGYNLASLVPKNRLLLELSPVMPLKAVKNLVEIESFREVNIRDGATLARAYAWLEKAVYANEAVTEFTVAQKIQEFREKSDLFICIAYNAIVGVNANGAVNHYSPTAETGQPITSKDMVLIDSGASYKDGTTDITRTFHFGEPTDFQKDAYTRVLKGYMALKNAIFPKYTVGNRIDTFARQFLWQAGLDFKHGTGHGIGLFVHEYPYRMIYDHALAPDDLGLRENLLFTDEPGYYEAGSFGIRLENTIRVVNSSIVGKNGEPYLTFEELTFLPYSRKLIKMSMLTEAEVQHINQYHQKCRETVGKYLKENYPDDVANDWLNRETEPL